MKTNIQQHETIQFPSGQEVTKEGKLKPLQSIKKSDLIFFLAPQEDLQLLMHRIREVINVLNDFKNKREENRSRKDYIDLLRQDLCNYYSYNDFLMNKLIDLFPLAEVMKSKYSNISFSYIS